MATKAKPKGIDPTLEAAIAKLLAQVMNDPEASVTEKMKVVDRALKLEAIKLKISDDAWGVGLFGGDDDINGE